MAITTEQLDDMIFWLDDCTTVLDRVIEKVDYMFGKKAMYTDLRDVANRLEDMQVKLQKTRKENNV